MPYWHFPLPLNVYLPLLEYFRLAYQFLNYYAVLYCVFMQLYIISSVFIILNLNIFWELNDHVLLLIILLQMLIATRRESRGGSESNDQMSLRNKKIFKSRKSSKLKSWCSLSCKGRGATCHYFEIPIIAAL